MAGLLKLKAKESLLRLCVSDLKVSGLWSCVKMHQEMLKQCSVSAKAESSNNHAKAFPSTYRPPGGATSTKNQGPGSFDYLRWTPGERSNTSGGGAPHFPFPPDLSRDSGQPRRPDGSRHPYSSKNSDKSTTKMREWGHGSSIVCDRTAMRVPSALLAEDILQTLVNRGELTVSSDLVEALQICLRSPNMTLKEIAFRTLSSLSSELSTSQMASLPSASLWELLFKASKSDNRIIHSRFTQSLFGFLVTLDGTKFNCRCKNGLKPFQTQHAHYHCDVCRTKLPINTPVHGCRNCDYDVCNECFQQLSSSAQTTPCLVASQSSATLSLLQQEDQQLVDVTLEATAKLTSSEATTLRNSYICVPEATAGSGLSSGLSSGSAPGCARKKRQSKKERRLAKKSREYEDKKEFKRRASIGSVNVNSSNKHSGLVLRVEDEAHGSGSFELILKKPLNKITVGELQAAVRDHLCWICSPFELRLTLQPLSYGNRRYRKGMRQRNRRPNVGNNRGVRSLYPGSDHSASTTPADDNANNAGSNLKETFKPRVMIDPAKSVAFYGLKMGSTITCRRIDRMVPLQFLRTNTSMVQLSNLDCTASVSGASSDEWQVVYLAKSVPTSGTCYWEMIIEQCEVYSERISLCIGVCAVNKDDLFAKKSFPPRQLWVR